MFRSSQDSSVWLRLTSREQLYIYLYTYIYICIHTYTYIYNKYIYIYIFVYVYMYENGFAGNVKILDCKIVTDLYIKALDRHLYLQSMFSQPYLTKQSLVYSQAL